MRLAIGASAIMIATGGCLSFGDLTGGIADAGADLDGGASDGSLADSSIANDATTSDGGGDGGCTGTAGAAQIRVGSGAASFCIDSTEATVRDYRLFLASIDGGGGSVTQSPECSWNTSFAVNTVGDQFDPITGVDWCDAYAFCEWAGKHLCGEIGGGAVPYDDSIGDPAKSQWLSACSHAADGGIAQYPYGSSPSASACNGSERDAGTVVEVGSLPSCVGGYPGVFDMSGNVDEWTNVRSRDRQKRLLHHRGRRLPRFRNGMRRRRRREPDVLRTNARRHAQRRRLQVLFKLGLF